MAILARTAAIGKSARSSLDLIEGRSAIPFRAACNMGLEGLVSKRADRPYRGRRSKDWIKVKNRGHHAFDRVARALR
jgi:ATP-dependent DNA ligase